MPFTLAHPAAAVPLRRWLGRYGSVSALVIGSMTPDLAYFLPLGVSREQSHSVAGLLWWCLPVGAAVYLLFHALLAPPLVALAPRSLRSRLASIARVPGPPTRARALAIALSLTAGAATHIAWDSFTHDHGTMVRAFGWLRQPIGVVWGYRLETYRLLQHASSVVGLLVIALWLERWWRRAPAGAPAPEAVPRGLRIVLLAALVIGTLAASALAAAPHAVGARDLATIRPAVGAAVTSAMTSCAIGILVYALAWHLWRHVRMRVTGATGRPSPWRGI